jgi:hypothetical protein
MINKKVPFGFQFPPALAGGILDDKRFLGFSQKVKIRDAIVTQRRREKSFQVNLDRSTKLDLTIER